MKIPGKPLDQNARPVRTEADRREIPYPPTLSHSQRLVFLKCQNVITEYDQHSFSTSTKYEYEYASKIYLHGKVHWSHAGVKIWELDIIHTSEAFPTCNVTPPHVPKMASLA